MVGIAGGHIGLSIVLIVLTSVIYDSNAQLNELPNTPTTTAPYDGTSVALAVSLITVGVVGLVACMMYIALRPLRGHYNPCCCPPCCCQHTGSPSNIEIIQISTIADVNTSNSSPTERAPHRRQDVPPSYATVMKSIATPKGTEDEPPPYSTLFFYSQP